MLVAPYRSTLSKTWSALARFMPGRALSPALSLDAVLESSKKEAGSSDFGETDFLRPLERLLASVEETGGLHPFGRFYVKKMISGLLVNRLKLVALWSRHPEILNQTIKSPVIILGLPRTGTSFLFNILSKDPAQRVLTNWEATVSQVPPEGDYTFSDDPRRKLAKYLLRFQSYLAPQMGEMHTFHLDGPEECTTLLMQGFTTQALAGMFNVPSYSEWLDAAPHLATYRHHKRVLQTLQWKYPARRWVLKSPAHTEAIEDLMEVYPDACLVQMHRDPVKAVSSFASLCGAFRGIYLSSIDYEELGQQSLNRLAIDFDRYLTQRKKCDATRFLDLQYHDLVSDPLATVKGIYSGFDLEFSDEARTCMESFLSKDRIKKTRHKYSPGDFGLTPQVIRQRFKTYIDAFNIPDES